MLSKFYIRVVGLVLLSSLVLSGGAFAQDNTEYPAIYADGDVELLQCPHLDCAIVTNTADGAELTVLTAESGDIVEDSDQWLLVEAVDTGLEGYVHVSSTIGYGDDFWREMPIIPEMDDSMREVYLHGLELGNNSQAFSVVGDCQNVSAYFLADFEHPLQYGLGEHENLQETIDYFAGSFGRERAAVRGGYNVASVLSPMWADPEQCEKGENPLSCEYRLQQPSFVLISMETWWEGQPIDAYEQYLRQVVEYWLENGVVPILATKADDLEGDHRINAAIARVALAYDVPLWNFWLAVQPLPDHGLTEDEFHLTYGRPFFNDAGAMATGWAMRNLTALQALDAVRLGVMGEE